MNPEKIQSDIKRRMRSCFDLNDFGFIFAVFTVAVSGSGIGGKQI